ncbi:MAG: PilZ domain-containing protein [Thermodesulfobacteriota bacterium]|nr:PilZ domain-containing protein [Thermodesulfobacteriota bacterium]
MNEVVEQRRHARFQVPVLSAYVMIPRPGPRSPIVGNIVDIGLGGVSFCYIAGDERPHTSSHLHILLPDRSFLLDSMPVRTVSSDFQLEHQTPVNVATRRCGVTFGDLTDDQKSDLTFFIRTLTAADPEA